MYKIRGADQRDYGPATADQVRQWIAEQRLNAQSLVQPAGTEGWKPLSELPEFAAALAGAVPGPGPLAPLSSYRPSPPTNSMAITGLVMGCLSIMCCPVLGILGIIFSAMALSELKGQSVQTGRGAAMAGLVLSILSFAFYGLLFAFGAFANLIQQLMKK